MGYLIRATPLYNLIRMSVDEGSEKIVLDCGAGGSMPPLYLFHSLGYETAGVEIDERQIAKARGFCSANNVELNIKKGDMRSLPFGNDSFGVVYSYNSVFHMTKQDIGISVQEMIRVLKPGGFCYFNLLSVEDDGYGEGKELNQGEFIQEERDGEAIHSYYTDEEIDGTIRGARMAYKEKRSIYIYDDDVYHPVYLDYIVRKT